MEDNPGENQQVAIQIASTDLTVAPGGSLHFPISVHNESLEDRSFQLTVAGIPSNWVSVPAPVIHLAAGEQREELLTVQPPTLPQDRAGRYQVVVHVASRETPYQAAEATCTLTVADLVAPGRISILLAATEFPVAVEESVAIPLILLNQGLESDIVSLSVEGIPSSWVTASRASTSLSPGQQQEVTLTLTPIASEVSSAGRHPFRILATSEAAPGQVTVAECVLSIAKYSRFTCELHPQRLEAGEPARVMVGNRGNTAQAYTLTWQSSGSELGFAPASTQELPVQSGQVAVAEFRAKPRSRPLFGSERVLPYTTRVQAAEGAVRHLSGEVVAKPMISTTLAVAVLAVLVACICLGALGAIYVTTRDGTPPEAPAATAPADQEQPAGPPAEKTVEPPPEQPAEPPTEPPPEAEPTGFLPPQDLRGLARSRPCRAEVAGSMCLLPLA